MKYANRYGPNHIECVKLGAMFNRALDRNIYDEVHLREVSRRVASATWEEDEEKERSKIMTVDDNALVDHKNRNPRIRI